MIQRDKNIKQILQSNNDTNDNIIENKKELEKLWVSFEKHLNIS